MAVRSFLVAAFLWVLFGIALLLQWFAPRLKIEHNAFVIPSEMIAEGKEFSPADIIARERAIRGISGVLALVSALGLGCYYRSALLQPWSSSQVNARSVGEGSHRS